MLYVTIAEILKLSATTPAKTPGFFSGDSRNNHRIQRPRRGNESRVDGEYAKNGSK
jgi:hypothetical protein